MVVGAVLVDVREGDKGGELGRNEGGGLVVHFEVATKMANLTTVELLEGQRRRGSWLAAGRSRATEVGGVRPDERKNRSPRHSNV